MCPTLNKDFIIILYILSVLVDAAHPTVNRMSDEEIMQAVSAVVKNELNMRIQKVVVPERNENSSSSTKSFLAYASTVDYGGGGDARRGEELSESVLSSELDAAEAPQYYDVEPSDSASQISVSYFSDSTAAASIVDYNEPNQLVMTKEDNGASLRQVTQSETRVNIKEPQLVTVGNTVVNAILDDGSVGDLVLEEVDADTVAEDEQLIPEELQKRLDFAFGTGSHIFVDQVPSESAVPSSTLATQQKDKYSASNDIRASNFNNITSRLAKIAGKANRELVQVENRLDRQGERAKRAALNRYVKANIGRGLLEANPSTQSFEEDKKEQLEEKTELAMGSVKIMEKTNRDRVTKSLHKLKKVVLKKPVSTTIHKKKKTSIKTSIKTKPTATKATVKTTTKAKEAKLNTRKRRLIEEQVQYKVNIRKQQSAKKKRSATAVQDVNARLRHIENLQRNMLERLVTKPLPDDENSPFITNGQFDLSA